MKKTLAFLFAGCIAAAAFAGKDDVVVMFSTQGPDCYADGTTVVNGEIYALVWTPSGETFAGINADGTAAGKSKIALKAPVAKDGKCPLIRFTIDEAYAAKNYSGGTWAVCLLDTRRFKVDANGALTDELESVGGKIVNGYGEVGARTSQHIIPASVNAAALARMTSKVPEGAKDLKVNSIKVIDENVYIHVSGALSCMRYGLKKGKPGEALKSTEGAYYGADEKELIIVTPRVEGGEIISVESK